MDGPDLPPRPDGVATRPGETNPTATGQVPPSPVYYEARSRPPSRTIGAVAPTNRIVYERNNERVIGYIIPLPKPVHNGVELDVPQRYMLYTPPAPHLLKPAVGKEKKRLRVQRWWQKQVKNAKTFEGKTASWRGIHSKSIRYALWMLNLIESSDVTFLSRVPNKTTTHLILIHPPASLASLSTTTTAASTAAHDETLHAQALHTEFRAQLFRSKKLARRDGVISVVILPAVAVFDFFFPLGGLTEINIIWMAANFKAWRTGRNILKRLSTSPSASSSASETTTTAQNSTAAETMRPEPVMRGHAAAPIHIADPTTRTTEKTAARREPLSRRERLKRRAKTSGKGAPKPPLQLTFDASPAMVAMTRYVAEQCHARNGAAFRSAGVPPTGSDVLASIGWKAERRGREHEDEHEDVAWQTRQAKDDLLAVSSKAAKSYDKFCKKYAKYPERALSEKGHSSVSSAMYRLKLKKDTRQLRESDGGVAAPSTGTRTTAAVGAAPAEKKGPVDVLKGKAAELRQRMEKRRVDKDKNKGDMSGRSTPVAA